MTIWNPRESLGEYAWVWDAVCWLSAGEAWPEGDEDQLRELADQWQQFSDAITAALNEADPAVMQIAQAWGGGAGGAFNTLWNQIGVGAETGLPLLASSASALSASVSSTAQEIEYAKLTVLIAVIITVISVFVALLMAWLGGVSATAIPGILAGGRQVVTMAMNRLLMMVGRKALVKGGEKLLKEAGEQVAKKTLKDTLKHGAKHLGKEMVEEVGEELIIDVGAQAYQINKGTRDGLDGKRTLMSGTGGAIGAVIGAPVGKGFSKVAGAIPTPKVNMNFKGAGAIKGVGNWAGNAVSAGTVNAVVSPASSVLTNAAFTGQWEMPGASDFLGGFTGGAGRPALTGVGTGTGNLLAAGTNGAINLAGKAATALAGPPSTTAPIVGDTNTDTSVIAPVGGDSSGSSSSSSSSSDSSSSSGSSASGSDSPGSGSSTSSAGSSAGAGGPGRAPEDGSDGPDGSGPPSGDTALAGSTATAETPATGAPGGANGSDAGDTVATPPPPGTSTVQLQEPSPPAETPSTSDSDTETAPAANAPVASDTPAPTPGASGPVADSSSPPPGGDSSSRAGAPATDTPSPSPDSSSSSPSPSSSSNASAPGSSAPSPGLVSSEPSPGLVSSAPDAAGPITDAAVSPGAVSDTTSNPSTTTPTVVPTGMPGSPATVSTGVPGSPLTGGSPNLSTSAPATVSPTTGPSTTTQAAPVTNTATATSPAGPNTTSTTSGPSPANSSTTATGTNPSSATGRINPNAPHLAGGHPDSRPIATTGTVHVAPATDHGPLTSDAQVGTPDHAAPAAPAPTTDTPSPDRNVPASSVDTNVDPNSDHDSNQDNDARTDDRGTTSNAADNADTNLHSDDGPSSDGDRSDPALVVVPVSTGSASAAVPTIAGGVDPDTFAKSKGATVADQVGYRLSPVQLNPDIDVHGEEAQAILINASRTLAQKTLEGLKPGSDPKVSKSKTPGMAGAMLTPTGRLYTHTSMRTNKGAGSEALNVHPSLNEILAEIKKAYDANDQRGAFGHGKCAEVALVSDALHDLQKLYDAAQAATDFPAFAAAARSSADFAGPTDEALLGQYEVAQSKSFDEFAKSQLRGTQMVTHQIIPTTDVRAADHGTYEEPCETCRQYLPTFGIEPVTDVDRLPGDTIPPDTGALGNGQPLSDSRPVGDQGLTPPAEADQQALDNEVPRTADGRPAVHPDPRTSQWPQLVNDGGPDVPGRNTNCADVGLSVLSTWYGNPQVSGAMAQPNTTEAASTARQEQWLGSGFDHQGAGRMGLDAVADQLLQAGPGSAAIIISTWSDGGVAHTWNAVNSGGTVVWIDAQTRQVSDTAPLYADRVANSWSITLDAAGRPTNPAAVSPASTRSATGATTGPSSQERLPADRGGAEPSPARESTTYRPAVAHLESIRSSGASGDGQSGEPSGPPAADPSVGDGDPGGDSPGHTRTDGGEQDGLPSEVRDEAADGTADAEEFNPLTERGDDFASLKTDEQAVLETGITSALLDAEVILGDLTTLADQLNADHGPLGADEVVKLVGVDHRVKSLESTARKFKVEHRPVGQSMATALGAMNDVVRFSLRAPEQAYGAVVAQALETMRAQGYQVGKPKNFWAPGNRFFGLNVTVVSPPTLQSPTGRTFELQFPTEFSLQLGKLTHDPYETLRDVGRTAVERIHAYLDILATNVEKNASQHMPTGMSDRDVFPAPKDKSLASWLREGDNDLLFEEYRDWLTQQGGTFAEQLAVRNLDRSNVPGLDPSIWEIGDGSTDVPIQPGVRTGRSGGEPDSSGGVTAQPDSASDLTGTVAGSGVGPSDAAVDLPATHRVGDASSARGSASDKASGSSDGRAAGSGFRDEGVAGRGGVDGDLRGSAGRGLNDPEVPRDSGEVPLRTDLPAGGSGEGADQRGGGSDESAGHDVGPGADAVGGVAPPVSDVAAGHGGVRGDVDASRAVSGADRGSGDGGARGASVRDDSAAERGGADGDRPDGSARLTSDGTEGIARATDEVPLLPSVRAGEADFGDGAPEPDRGGGVDGPAAGGGVGSRPGGVDVPAGRGGGDSAFELGGSPDAAGGSGDGGARGASVRDEGVAQRGGVDGDLSEGAGRDGLRGDGPAGPPAESGGTGGDGGADLRRAAAGTTFGGVSLAEDVGRTERAVDAALSGGVLPAGAVVDERGRGVELGGHRVRFEFVSPAGPVAPVATTHAGVEETVVRVSTAAEPDFVRRAVAAALAEAQQVQVERAAGVRVDATRVLSEGSREDTLSARDAGRVAELAVLASDLESETDPGRRAQLEADAHSLLITSGLLEGPRDVHGHEGNVPVVGADAVAARLGLVGQHPAVVGLLAGVGGAAARETALRAAQAEVRATARDLARQAIAERDRADARLTAYVDSSLDVDPQHVFTRLVIGGGWAATADFVTMGAPGHVDSGMPPVLAIAEQTEPWAGRADLGMGQVPAELELPGLPFQPADFAEDGTAFTPSSVFATTIGAARALSGMPTYHGLATSVESRARSDGAGWPEGAEYKVTVGERTFWASSVDVATGPGPARVPSPATSPDGRYADPATGYSVEHAGGDVTFRDPEGTVVGEAELPAAARTVIGGERPLLVDTTGTVTDTRIADVDGDGQPTGWTVDAATGVVYDADGRPSDAAPAPVRARLGIGADGRFTDPRTARPSVDFGGANLADAYREHDAVLVFGAGASAAWDVEQAAAGGAGPIEWAARASMTDDIRAIKDDADRQRALVEESFKGGKNRRNTLPGQGAYDIIGPQHIKQSLRELSSVRHTVDGRFLVTFSDGAQSSFDRVVFSVGLAGELPGGPAALLDGLPLRTVDGPPTTGLRGQRDVLGLGDGRGLRVLGAAAVDRTLQSRLANPQRARQVIGAQAKALPADSNNIAPSIRFHAQRIAEANRLAGPPAGSDGSPQGPAVPGPSGPHPREGAEPLVEGGTVPGVVDVLGAETAVEAESGAPRLDGDPVAAEVEPLQGGHPLRQGGDEGIGVGDAGLVEVEMPQPAEPVGGAQRPQTVVAERAEAQDQTAEPVDQRADGEPAGEGGIDVAQADVADGQPLVQGSAVLEEGRAAQHDGLGEATVRGEAVEQLAVDPELRQQPLVVPETGVAEVGETRGGSLGQGHQADVLTPARVDLLPDEQRVAGVGALDGVGVGQPDVEVIRGGQDGGVQLGGGQAHPASLDTAGVLAEARRALPSVVRAAEVTSIVELNRDYYEVHTGAATAVRVRLRVGPLTGTAQTTRDNDGNYTLTVSDRADGRAIRSALAREIAGLAALHNTHVSVPAGVLSGGAGGPIDPAGLSAYDRGRLAEIRALAEQYAGADRDTRTALRATVDALAEQLGLRAGDSPDTRARWSLVPPDVTATLSRLSTPAISSAYAQHTFNSRWDTDAEHYRQRDYRLKLFDQQTMQPLSDPEIAAKLRELAVAAEHDRSGVALMPEHAGQIISLPNHLLNRIHQADPQLAARVAAEGVYVDLSGRPELGPYSVTGLPMPNYADAQGVIAYDMSTPEGRYSLLMEDRARVEAAIRRTPGAHVPPHVLATHSLQYFQAGKTMFYVPDALTAALAEMAPEPVRYQEGTATSVTSTATTALAHEVTIAAADRVTVATSGYGRVIDPATGQPVPLFNGPPTRHQARQGGVGDCGMIATIGAVAGHRPDLLSRMIQPNPDGTVDVVFHETSLPGALVTPTGRELRITVTPDVPLSSFNTAESAYARQVQVGASWAAVVEKAVAALDRTWTDARRDQWQDMYNRVTNTTDVAAPSGYARLTFGSLPLLQAELLSQLTGLPARTARFNPTAGVEPATEARLSSLLAAGNPVIVGSRGAYPGGDPFGLVPGHAYELAAVSQGQVWLRDPYDHRHPDPMTIREFLDSVNQSFAYLDAPAPQPSPPAPTPARSSFEVPHTAGRIHTDDYVATVTYYAVMSAGAEAEGLTVVASDEHGPKVGRWTARPEASGAGGERPVTRETAERIAAEVLGFVLPDELSLRDMLGR
nr:toxin glutamine deamidase domain-containing protein [Actinoplanes sp. RD1]